MEKAMSRVCNLLMVTANNNNKFYNMYEEGDTLRVEYGRVGANPQICTYHISKWDSLKHAKEKKGYKEVTGYKAETQSANIVCDNKEVESIVKILLNKSRDNVKANYNVSYKDVTQHQIDEAQNVLNSLLDYRKKRVEVEELNKRLINLYTIVPRKMGNVKDYLLPLNEDFNDVVKPKLKQMISTEQDLLDNMSTLVDQNTDSEGEDILSIAGLEMCPVDDKEKKLICKKLGDNKNQYIRAFKVINKKTQSKYDNIDKVNKTTDLLWHGSRTENWWSILSKGLMIRPAGAIHTGSMYGDGLYFATKAQKSIGYTSLSNSYWASGSDSRAYLALYEVYLGKSKDIYEHTYKCYDLDYKTIQKDKCDSVFAHAGVSLKNDEIIIYRPEQCTVKYIVEIGR